MVLFTFVYFHVWGGERNSYVDSLRDNSSIVYNPNNDSRRVRTTDGWQKCTPANGTNRISGARHIGQLCSGLYPNHKWMHCE